MNYIVILYKIKKPIEEYRSKVICLYDFSLSSHPEIIYLEANKNILVLNKTIVEGNSVAFNYLSVLTNQEKRTLNR